MSSSHLVVEAAAMPMPPKAAELPGPGRPLGSRTAFTPSRTGPEPRAHAHSISACWLENTKSTSATR
eukprot:2123807-Lingulodinium_polyedra.AAC.1